MADPQYQGYRVPGAICCSMGLMAGATLRLEHSTTLMALVVLVVYSLGKKKQTPITWKANELRIDQNCL